MGRKKIQIARIMDERNRHVSMQKTLAPSRHEPLYVSVLAVLHECPQINIMAAAVTMSLFTFGINIRPE